MMMNLLISVSHEIQIHFKSDSIFRITTIN